eukprot:GABV01010239.1.p1 GENE.GABV01010239.1~~GABV01010239.1.p1  ORF type:complete len:119 (+),score=19.24 GABV01010239.1:161-517(+)
MDSTSRLRRRDRTLAAYAEELAATGRQKEIRANALLTSLRRVEDQRTAMLRAIRNPEWEVPHHFHMTSLEHFRGNTQAHLMDIAIALSGKLHVCAVARSARLANQRLFPSSKNPRRTR